MNNIILPKVVAAGIYNAELALKNKDTTPNRKTTMFELEIATADGGISYIDDEYRNIKDGMIICAKPGQLRHTGLSFICYYVHLIVTEGQLYDILSSVPNYPSLENTDEIKEIFREICKHYEVSEPSGEIIIQSLILKLIYLIGKARTHELKNHTPKPNNHEVIEKTLTYINNNLTSPLKLQELAERAKFSKIYFHKLFKSSVGKTLGDYVEEQRIKRAIGLLVSSDMTLTAIAYECGFSSQSYFSYAFKRRMGTTPREYAKNVFKRYEKS